MGKQGETQHYDFSQYGVKLFFKSEVQVEGEKAKEGGIEQFKSCKRVQIEDEDDCDENENEDRENGMGLRVTVASSKAILEPANDRTYERAKQYRSVKQLPLPEVEDEQTNTSSEL